jgi:hypothetical protein
MGILWGINYYQKGFVVEATELDVKANLKLSKKYILREKSFQSEHSN